MFSQCYLCWSSAPWRPYQMTMDITGDFFFQIVLVHICSFSSFAILLCPQQSEMGSGKTLFCLHFAFLRLCKISLKWDTALYPAVFSSLLAWTEFLVSTQVYTYISISIKSFCCYICYTEQLTTGSHLMRNFYRQSTHLCPICQSLAWEHTQMLSERNSLFSSVDTFFLKTKAQWPCSTNEWSWFFLGAQGEKKILLWPVKWQEQQLQFTVSVYMLHRHKCNWEMTHWEDNCLEKCIDLAYSWWVMENLFLQGKQMHSFLLWLKSLLFVFN